MRNKYIVVESEAHSDDIQAEEFDSLQAATEYLSSVENMLPETTVELDWFT